MDQQGSSSVLANTGIYNGSRIAVTPATPANTEQALLVQELKNQMIQFFAPFKEQLDLLTDIELKFVENVDPLEDKFLDELISKHVLKPFYASHIKKASDTQEGRARKLWKALFRVPPSRFFQMVVPLLVKYYKENVLDQSEPFPATDEKFCIRDAVETFLPLKEIADILLRERAITTSDHSYLTGEKPKKERWEHLMKVFQNLEDNKVAAASEVLKSYFKRYEIPCPENLSQLISNGFPCICTFVVDEEEAEHHRVGVCDECELEAQKKAAEEAFHQSLEDKRKALYRPEAWYPPMQPPARKKKDIFKVEDFRTVDEWAKSAPKELSRSFDRLVAYLTKGMDSDLEKLRSIFTWMGQQNIMSRAPEGPEPYHESPEAYMRKAPEDLTNITILFAILCRQANMKCVMTRGPAKDILYEAGDSPVPGMSTWVTVCVDGDWRFVQPVYSFTGIINHHAKGFILVEENERALRQRPSSAMMGKEQLVSSVDEYWFLTDPEQFNIICHPPDPDQQLLHSPSTDDEFVQVPYLLPQYFQSPVRLLNSFSSVIELLSGKYCIDFQHPNRLNVTLMYKLYYNEALSARKFPEQLQIDRFVTRLKRPHGIKSLLLKLPIAGIYKLTVGCECEGTTYAILVEFRLICKDPSNTLPFPSNPDIGFGYDEATARSGLRNPSHKGAIIPVKAGESVIIKFQANNTARVRATLKHFDQAQVQRVQNVDIARQDRNTTVNVRLPEDEANPECALEINICRSGQAPGTAGGDDVVKEMFMNVLNYLLTSDQDLYNASDNQSTKEQQSILKALDMDNAEQLEKAMSKFNCQDPLTLARVRAKQAEYEKIRQELVESVRSRNIERIDFAMKQFIRHKLEDKGEVNEAETRVCELSEAAVRRGMSARCLARLKSAFSRVDGSFAEGTAQQTDWYRLGRYLMDELDGYSWCTNALTTAALLTISQQALNDQLLGVLRATFIILGDDPNQLQSWDSIKMKLQTRGPLSLTERIRHFEATGLMLFEVDRAAKALRPCSKDLVRAKMLGANQGIPSENATEGKSVTSTNQPTKQSVSEHDLNRPTDNPEAGSGGATPAASPAAPESSQLKFPGRGDSVWPGTDEMISAESVRIIMIKFKLRHSGSLSEQAGSITMAEGPKTQQHMNFCIEKVKKEDIVKTGGSSYLIFKVTWDDSETRLKSSTQRKQPFKQKVGEEKERKKSSFVLRFKGETDNDNVHEEHLSKVPIEILLDVVNTLYDDHHIRLLGVDSDLIFIVDSSLEHDHVLRQQEGIRKVLCWMLPARVKDQLKVKELEVVPCPGPVSPAVLRLGRPLPDEVRGLGQRSSIPGLLVKTGIAAGTLVAAGAVVTAPSLGAAYLRSGTPGEQPDIDSKKENRNKQDERDRLEKENREGEKMEKEQMAEREKMLISTGAVQMVEENREKLLKKAVEQGGEITLRSGLVLVVGEKEEMVQLMKERKEKERQKKDRMENERMEKERQDKERQDKERMDKERMKEKKEKERQKKERMEKERQDKERMDKEKIAAKEKMEKEKREKERMGEGILGKTKRLKERMENEQIAEKEKCLIERLEKVTMGKENTQEDGMEEEMIETNPVFSKDWEVYAEITSDGGLLHCADSDVSLHVPKNAVEVFRKVTVKSAVSTDLKLIHRELGLNDSETIASPVAEFCTSESFTFVQPVIVNLPHFLPEDCSKDKVRVYRFHLDCRGFLHIERLKQAKSETGELPEDGSFHFSAPQEIQVYTSHFTGFLCTLCDADIVPVPLRLRLYGRHVQRETRDVDLWLFVGDSRLDIRDFRKSVLPNPEDEAHFITKQSLGPVRHRDEVQLGICLVLDNLQERRWAHKKRCGGQPLHPAERRHDLEDVLPCKSCDDTQPLKVAWALHTKPNTDPSSWFSCSVEVGYITTENDAFRFLENPRKKILDVLELDIHKKRLTSSTTQTDNCRALAPPDSQSAEASVSQLLPSSASGADPLVRDNGRDNYSLASYLPHSSRTRTQNNQQTVPATQVKQPLLMAENSESPSQCAASARPGVRTGNFSLNSLNTSRSTSSAFDHSSQSPRDRGVLTHHGLHHQTGEFHQNGMWQRFSENAQSFDSRGTSVQTAYREAGSGNAPDHGASYVNPNSGSAAESRTCSRQHLPVLPFRTSENSAQSQHSCAGDTSSNDSALWPDAVGDTNVRQYFHHQPVYNITIQKMKGEQIDFASFPTQPMVQGGTSGEAHINGWCDARNFQTEPEMLNGCDAVQSNRRVITSSEHPQLQNLNSARALAENEPSEASSFETSSGDLDRFPTQICERDGQPPSPEQERGEAGAVSFPTPVECSDYVVV
ncbi:hypothetical protein BaRGS_00028439 [Batillaria attramentaria]|uniref:ZU5 domain-containing protein n=1 Tax=Batillaria attramentaria TaxID=370345 RepID=A0ABD0K014_9CAEN